jgi:hypothetical protein
METPDTKKRFFGIPEIIMLFFGLSILAYILLQKGGGYVVKRSETIEILDQPNGPKEKARKYDSAHEESVEALLQNMAEQFSENEQTEKPNKGSATKEIDQQLSADERKYYNDLRQKNSIQDKIESAKDWYRILSASQKTYSKVKEILGEASHRPTENIDGENVSQDLKNKEVSAEFYQRLSKTFNIPPEDLEAFGRSGKQALSDWASFVESKSKD